MNTRHRIRATLAAFMLAAVTILSALTAGFPLSVTASAATETPLNHVIINQVYGGSTDGYASHSFIELYNPTAKAVDLSGWTIQYKSSQDGDDSSTWQVLKLTGTIGPSDYYLIRCAAVTDTSNVKYSVPAGNQEWDMAIHNKGFSVVLVNGTAALSNDLAGDITTANISYVDCLAAQGNDAKAKQAPLVYEGSYSAIQSKKKAVRRNSFADTDNNANDCAAIDYSSTVSAANGPHVGTYVAEKNAQTVTVTDASGTSVTSETTISLTKGDTCQITAATTGNGTITYASSNSSYVTISEAGKITALGVGTATITVTAAETDSYAAGTASFMVRVSQIDQGYTLNTEGFTNGSSGSVDLTKLGSYVSGVSDADGGVTEIISYDSANNTAWSVNGKTGKLEIIDLTTLTCDLSDTNTDNLTAEELDVKSLMATAYPNFSYGDMTSVYINSDLGIAAVALQAAGYADNGYVALIDTNSRELLIALEVGCQPDMVCFTPDGTKILSANEGEPREGYGSGTTDPLGSVSIITLDTDNLSASAVKTVDFTAYDSQRDTLVNAGVILAKGASVSADLEPEYIAATDTTAYVALQEANAIAVLDLSSGAFTGIYSLGYKDLSLEANAIDLIDDGDYVAKTYPGAVAAYMPDGISVYTAGGQTYILTANEGDSREWGSYSNESKTTLTASDGTTAAKVRAIDSSVTDGLPSDKTVLLGGRSFSIYQVSSNGLTQVYDSANDFEENTADYVASYFNCSNDDNDYDSRSQKKGPEPETVTVGTINGRTYAFIALERIGGIMMYDITDPSNAYFINYINSRDYSEDPSSGASLSSDISPEGLYFISAEASASGTPILLTAFEVSGTVAAYAVGDTPTGHTYGEPVFYWSADHSSCTAVFTCSKCGDQQTVVCTVSTQTTAATATETGLAVYTAACTFDGEEYSAEYSEEIPASGASDESAGSATEASGGSADSATGASGESADSATQTDTAGSGSNTATTTTAAAAATGDTARIYRWILLALCGAGCAAGIGICKKQHTDR